MQVQPYLFFDGRAEEALQFYTKVLGAEVKMLMRFSDSPEPPQQSQEGCASPGAPDKIMHSEFSVGDTTIMASDGHCAGTPEFKGFGLSLNPKTDAEAKKLFAALADGGQVLQPQIKTFFSPSFGMVGDKFGVMWMVVVQP